MVDASLLHLLRRTTYGPTPTSIAEATRLGRRAWLERQLAPSTVKDSRCTTLMARFPGLTWSIPTVRQKLAGGSWEVMDQLTQATLSRAVWSHRQLFEVMVEFWSNHLNIANPSSDVWDNRAHYDRTVIRPHALGSFTDLLAAATTHPAMLTYLNNASSTRWHPNENHGRELLELHTVGVDAGYTEAEVQASARILTGFTIDPDGEFVYRPAWHAPGAVSVLGFEHANATAAGGPQVLAGYLHHLATHPATAARIARKLAIRFVRDDPPKSLVNRLATAYLDAGTQIIPVLRLLFGSPEFAAAAGKKVRRPYEDLVATVRVLGLQPDRTGVKGPQALGWIAASMGHAPLAWPPPDGYPDDATSWQSPAGTLARWNLHLSVAARWWPGKDRLTGSGAASLLPEKLPGTHGALIDALALKLIHRRASAAEKAALCTFLTDQYTDVKPGTRLTAKSAAVGWRLPYLVALLLATPTHATR